MSLFHTAQFKAKDGKVTVWDDGKIGVPKRMTVIPPADVVDIAVEDGQAASKRITVARVLAVGILAPAFKKKVAATKYLIVETVDDAHVVELDIKDYAKARKFAAQAMALVRKGQAAAAEEAAPVVDVAPEAPAEPAKRPWWQKTTGELINERRARKGKSPLNFETA